MIGLELNPENPTHNRNLATCIEKLGKRIAKVTIKRIPKKIIDKIPRERKKILKMLKRNTIVLFFIYLYIQEECTHIGKSIKNLQIT